MISGINERNDFVGWQVRVRWALGKRDGMKSIEMHVQRSLGYGPGDGFPLAMLGDRIGDRGSSRITEIRLNPNVTCIFRTRQRQNGIPTSPRLVPGYRLLRQPH
jgi:hypothetical protein